MSRYAGKFTSRLVSDDPQVRLGQQVRHHRKRMELTLRDVAKETGLGIATLSLIERGKVDCRYSTLRKLAQAFGLTLRELTLED